MGEGELFVASGGPEPPRFGFADVVHHVKFINNDGAALLWHLLLEIGLLDVLQVEAGVLQVLGNQRAEILVTRVEIAQMLRFLQVFPLVLEPEQTSGHEVLSELLVELLLAFFDELGSLLLLPLPVQFGIRGYLV